MNTQPSSSALRARIVQLETDATAAAERITAAEADYAAEIRADLTDPTSSNDPKRNTTSEVDAANDDLFRINAVLREARYLLADAIAREEAEAETAAHAEIAAITDEMTAAARDADTAFAAFLGTMTRARKAEKTAREIVRAKLSREPAGPFVMSTALTDAEQFIRNVRNGNPDPYEPFTAKRAQQATRRIADAPPLSSWVSNVGSAQ